MTKAAHKLSRRSRSLLSYAGRLTGAVLVALFICSVITVTDVSAHANLDELRSNPTPDSVNEVPPETIRLWFTEPLDPDQSTIQVFDETGQQVDAGDATVDPGDPHQMAISLGSVPDGTYRVSWSALSTVDGHPSQGTFSFQVGQARLPGGAATTEGERPSIDAVALRWLTFGGLALVAGWFLLHPLSVDISSTNRSLALVAGAVTLLADLYQVPQNLLASQQDTGLVSTIRDMPPDWYVRVVLELVLLGAIGLIVRRQTGNPARLLGLALSAIAVASLTYTTHAAAESTQALALPVNALHLLSVAFWLGGLAHLALASVTTDEIDRAVLGRFSRFALVAAAVALLTGFVNAGLLLPTVESTWSSAYGQTLILKLVLVVGALALAWFNRKRLSTYLTHLRSVFRTLRTEALFGIGAILIASFMALSALPSIEEDEPLHLRTSAGESEFAHFQMPDPDTGENDVSVWLSDGENEPLENIEEVRVQFSMLESDTDIEREAEQQPDGRWLIPEVDAGTKGWWRATVDFIQGSETATTEFVYLLPDPTLAGGEFDRSTEQAAVERYQTALSQLLDLESMTAVENLGDGAGNGVRTEYEYAAPNRLRYVTSSGNESIAIGGDQYLLKDGEDEWMVRDRRQPYSFPDVFSFFYSGARDVTLGREVQADGRTYQLVSFYVPEVTGRTEAWYLWYIDTETGHMRREAMIAHHHYMDNQFGDFDEPVTIERPDDGSIADDDKGNPQDTAGDGRSGVSLQ